MKRFKILQIAMVSLLVLNVGGFQAKAIEPESTTEKTSSVIVEIKDNEDITDPVDPEDPDQEHLTLEKVPALYGLETELLKGNYEIEKNFSEEEESIDVYNNKYTRDWAVKAKFTDNKLTSSRSNKEFDVNSFKINDRETIGTGIDGIVAESKTDKTVDNNSGLISTKVNKVSISFTDPELSLKAEESAQGVIEYKLIDTAYVE